MTSTITQCVPGFGKPDNSNVPGQTTFCAVARQFAVNTRALAQVVTVLLVRPVQSQALLDEKALAAWLAYVALKQRKGVGGKRSANNSHFSPTLFLLAGLPEPAHQ